MSGQILNTNSQWLGQACEKIGLSNMFHLCVSDSRPQIFNAAKFLSQHSQVVTLSGGLGPTSDDFTREVVSELVGAPLEWRQEAWDHLTDYLENRGSKVRPSHKQECYFPKDAHIFINQNGTACAFACETQNNLWIVLPGPPREVHALWQNSIEPFLLTKVKGLEIMKTWSIHVFGQPESGVAEIVDPHLVQFPYEIGYRIHLPYIELKLRYPQKQETQVLPFIKNVTQALATEFTTPSKTKLFEAVILQIKSLSSKKINRVYICNPQNCIEINRRFAPEVESFDSSLTYLPLGPSQILSQDDDSLFFTWEFVNNNKALMVHVYQSSTPLLARTIASPLSSNHSLERRKKDLIERALFDLVRNL